MTRRESPPAAPVPSRSSATSRSFGRVARAGLVGGATIVAVGAASACLDRPVAPAEPRTSNTFSEKVSLTKIDKIDLLFMIDNSASMADKQSILATAVPDLVSRLVRPSCASTELDANGQPKSIVPQTAGGCAPGFALEFNAIRDIHIGIVTSSLGGHGADVCIPGAVNTGVGQDDRAHLLTRGVDPVQTWRGTGFFQWDPDKAKDPPGSGFDASGSADPLVSPFTAVVKGAGQTGCGYEASLEAWYRFLVEPAPPNQVGKTPDVGNPVTPTGVDDELLQQRAEFLRPDSLLAVVVLSDENDCSVAEGILPAQVKRFTGSTAEVPEGWEDLALNNSFPINYIVGQGAIGAGAFRMKSGTSACSDNPKSPGCQQCFTEPNASDPASGCRTLAPDEDNRTLRCWDQKRRFGVDTLYPVQRYVDGLREATIFPLHDRVVKTRVMKDQPPPERYADTDLVPNPIFQDLPYLRFQELKARFAESLIDQATFDAKAASLGDSKLTKGNRAAFPARGADTVFFAAIVGVPWQDIAVDPTDLKKGYKTADKVTWENLRVTGDKPPLDPLMREAVDSRAVPNEVHPVTKEPINLTENNRINGHEWKSGKQDLMYTCRFPLAAPKDCSKGAPDCDCNYADSTKDPSNTQIAADAQANPLCQDPTTGKFGETQHFAKAYPGSRFMEVMNRFQSGSIIASICTPNVDRPGEADFGYRPAVNAIIDRLKSQLTGRCTPRRLAANPDGSTPCLIVDAQLDATGGGASSEEVEACRSCKGVPGREPLDKSPQDLEALLRRNPDVARFQCLCKVTQFAGTELEQCKANQQPASPAGENTEGWCYVDNSASGAADANELTKNCPSHSTIRLATETNKSTFFITCLGAAIGSGGGVDVPAAPPAGTQLDVVRREATVVGSGRKPAASSGDLERAPPREGSRPFARSKAASLGKSRGFDVGRARA